MQISISLLAMLTAHFIADFVLQWDELAEKKAKHCCWLVVHIAVVGLVTWLLLGMGWTWHIVALICIAHVLIDLCKPCVRRVIRDLVTCCEPKRDWNRPLLVFLTDQCLHVLAIAAIWWGATHWSGFSISANYWTVFLGEARYAKLLVLCSGFTVGLHGVGFVLKYQMAPLALKLKPEKDSGLPEGGKTIGLLERLLVLIFVLAGKPEGVAFVVAAKSVFRIGDLANHDDRIAAEYIMIGTLRSFAYAIVIAFLMKWLPGHIQPVA